MSALATRLAELRVVVCAGAGGVGKTTLSATVALGLAARGRRVALVTIDPAHRLAEALGLDELGNEPRLIDAAALEGPDFVMRGELHAMMLDAKRTFDDAIAQLAPDAATRDQILANPIYAHLSTAVAGSQEYTAITKLYDIVAGGDYDAIVIDTPPSRSAMSFLDAPARLIGFLEARGLPVLLSPSGRALNAARVTFAAMRRVTGVALLEDLTSFFALLSSLLDGFHSRAAAVQSLLTDPSTGFVIVTSTERRALDEAILFAAELEKNGMHRCGVVVNRVRPLDPGDAAIVTTTARLAPSLGVRLAGKVAQIHADSQRLARRDRAGVARLEAAMPELEPACLREREVDIHDMRGIVALQRELFEESAIGTRERGVRPAG